MIFIEKMSRMNVRKNMKLTRTFESYWDMLPSEIKAIILRYKESQEAIDEERKERMREVCRDIVMYARVKRKWGIGHVKCRVVKGPCVGCHDYHMRVFGCYVNAENVEREVYLAYNLRRALRRIDAVKSSL